MEVKREPFFLPKQTPYGEVKKRYGHDRVIVNGRLAGYVPIEGEPSADVFHPLSGFPQELCEEVAKALKLKGSFDAPIQHEPEAVSEDDE